MLRYPDIRKYFQKVTPRLTKRTLPSTCPVELLCEHLCWVTNLIHLCVCNSWEMPLPVCSFWPPSLQAKATIEMSIAVFVPILTICLHPMLSAHFFRFISLRVLTHIYCSNGVNYMLSVPGATTVCSEHQAGNCYWNRDSEQMGRLALSGKSYNLRKQNIKRDLVGSGLDKRATLYTFKRAFHQSLYGYLWPSYLAKSQERSCIADKIKTVRSFFTLVYGFRRC